MCVLGVYFGKQEFGLEKKGECPYVTMTLLVKGGEHCFRIVTEDKYCTIPVYTADAECTT